MVWVVSILRVIILYLILIINIDYLGMDTHDTGGHANYADKDTMFRYLRVRGPVPAGSVITVEPGVCFSSPPPIHFGDL